MCIRPLPPVARRLRSGFTLVELILFIVIVSVGLAGVLAVLNLTVSKSADPLPVKQSVAVAEGFIEEIMLKAYSNPSGGFSGAATQANRSQFDDVSDYAGYDQVGVYSVAGVSVLPGLESYRVQVSVDSKAAIGNAAATPAYLVTVTVTDPRGGTFELSGYRTNF